MKNHWELFEDTFAGSNPIHVIESGGFLESSEEQLMRKASGTFYTPSVVGNYLVKKALMALESKSGVIKVCDPFAGDGRLIEWLIHEGINQKLNVSWDIQLWDIHEVGILHAAQILEKLKSSGVKLDYETWVGDSFRRFENEQNKFDIVLTNPPWENLKPDHRELSLLPNTRRDSYVEALRKTVLHLEQVYPNSKSSGKYGGWGTNLSRVGFEATQLSVNDRGVLGIVLPLSFLADVSSIRLREWLLKNFSIVDIGYFDAESRPFTNADVGACTIVTKREIPKEIAPQITVFNKNFSIHNSEVLPLEIKEIAKMSYVLPLGFGLEAAKLSMLFSQFPAFEDFFEDPNWQLWAGRELDETRIKEHLSHKNGPLFIKGRMIHRFEIIETPELRVQKEGWKAPISVEHRRIVWRDISRSNQKRRMTATCIPPGLVAGNSLGVAYLRTKSDDNLMILLGLMSSFPFELQIRTNLATGHISLSTLRKVRLPRLNSSSELGKALANAVSEKLRNSKNTEFVIEALSLLAYELDIIEAEKVISCFPKVEVSERNSILNVYSQLRTQFVNS